MRSAGELLFQMREDVDAADLRIRPYVLETPLAYAPALSREWGAEVWLKLENCQVTGSFKARGAMNRLLSTPVSQRAMGVVAASTGNHGAASAWAAARLRIPCTVVAPESSDPSKLASIRAWDATVQLHGTDCVEAETEARRVADSRGLLYLSPYNDPIVVAGQGTVGAELARQLERVDALFVSVGGGGLVGGTAGYLKSLGREVTVVGCSPENSRVMYESVRAGMILDLPSEATLSDGTSGGVEKGAITFPLCRALVDEWELVSEPEIAEGIRTAIGQEHQLVEGSGGVALAAARRRASDFPGAVIVIVLCGANIGLDTLHDILHR